MDNISPGFEEMAPIQSLVVVIVGIPAKLRNKQLRDLSSVFQIHFSPPVFVRNDIGDENQLTDQRANELLLGRRLMAGEAGCAAAHKLARESSQADWTLVLEDDAVISTQDVKLALRLIEGLDPTIPQIVNLFNPESSSWAKPSLRRIGHPPSSTLAYLASAAVRFLDGSQCQQIGTADWPFHLANVKFFQLYGLGVQEAVGPSSVDPDRNRKSLALRERVLGLFRIFEIVKAYGLQGASFALLNPIRRDGYNLALTLKVYILSRFRSSKYASNVRLEPSPAVGQAGSTN